MIGYLRGSVIGIDEDTLLLDVGGVGYELTVSGSVLGANLQRGEELSLVVYTDVKENAITLFGFREQLERQVFILLKKVKGIGSRIAMNIVSSIGAEELLSTIGKGDIAALKEVPGIGKKTAERLVLELREQVERLPGEMIAARPSAPKAGRAGIPAPAGGVEADAVLALEKLGFAGERARSAVQEALAAAGGTASDAGELLRDALSRI